MAVRSLPLPLPQISPSAHGTPARKVATLWTQLEPSRQQELAQHLAEMIRRFRIPVYPMTEHPGEVAGNDYR